MTQKEIEEGNVLIATKLMGIERNAQGLFVYADNNNRHVSDLHYHDDYNWIMPAVEEVIQMPTGDGDTFYLRTLGVHEETGEFMARFNRCSLVMCEEQNDLNFVLFRAVVDFLKEF